MTLEDLIKDCNWKSVQNELLEEYPDVIDKIKAFEQAYGELKKLKPKQSKIKIKIQKVNDKGTENNEFVTVSGIGSKHEFGSSYNISATNWQDWLGMKIENETVNNFSLSQIISYCLYEMTFLGFNQEEIENNLKEIK